MPDKKEIKEGGYKVIGEALETFAAVLAMGDFDGEQNLIYATTRDGRRFLSSMPMKEADAQPRKTKGSFGL